MTIFHNCGIAVTHSLHDAYSFIKSLQHRGREAAGLAAISDSRLDVLKWKGEVNEFDLGDLHEIFPGDNYHTFFGHVRYATKGKKDLILEEAHPHTIGGTIEHRHNHVLIHDCQAVIVHNGQANPEHFSGINITPAKTGCDSEQLLHFYFEKGERELVRSLAGVGTIAIADKRRREALVFRDYTGIMPGVLGEKDDKYCVASEDIAFRRNGGKLIENLTPGAVYYLDAYGKSRKEKIIDPALAYCRFQYNYIAHVDSIMNGVSVKTIRSLLGIQCAREFPFTDFDFVTYVPRCPEDAARHYADELNLPFLRSFYKIDAERSFQGSTSEERKTSIDDNLHLLLHLVKRLSGKKVAVLEDSLVRGNVVKRVRHLLYEVANVKEARLISYTPPIGIFGGDNVPRGCLFGVDMPSNDHFIARTSEKNRSLEEISQEAGMPVHYLSPEGELNVYAQAGIPETSLCTYCTGGKYPFKP